MKYGEMSYDFFVELVVCKLDAVHPKMRDEPNAYKRAIIRMAMEEFRDVYSEAKETNQ